MMCPSRCSTPSASPKLGGWDRSSLLPLISRVRHSAATLNEALRQFEEAQKRGARFIDVGCMQINHYFHGRHFRSVEAMFDPHENVDYAARFLRELRAREGSWTLAAARYHAGPNNDPAQERYVCLRGRQTPALFAIKRRPDRIPWGLGLQLLAATNARKKQL